MADVRLSEDSVQGFRALTVGNGLIAFTIVPELGGKLTSLRDLRTGREWLWTNPRLPYRRVEHGASYVREADTGGWDECFPTVAPCAYPLPPWQGIALPDHGELWSQAWQTEVERTGGGGVAVRERADGVALPYAFERRIGLEPGSAALRFDYALRSTASHDLAFIWSAHPLLVLEPGMRLTLPEGAVVHVNQGGSGSAPDEGEYAWPLRASTTGGELNLTQLPDPSAGVAFKLWSRPLPEGWVALAARNGGLRFQFDPALLPQVGLWLNAGGWSGTGGEPYRNLGLEPCLGAQDSLQEAVERYGRYGTLPAGGAREWWLEARLSATQAMTP